MSDFPPFKKLTFYRETQTVATDHTEPISKMETAKDMLNNNAPKWEGEDCIPMDQALSAMKEIADKAWEAGQGYLLQRLDKLETGKTVTAPDKSTFMKELFPEADIKDPSASG